MLRPLSAQTTMRAVELCFYIDPETGELHICNHGVSEREVEEALHHRGEDHRGAEASRIAIGATKAGRVLRVIYSPDPGGKSAFVITAYDLQGKPLAAYRRRQRRR